MNDDHLKEFEALANLDGDNADSLFTQENEPRTQSHEAFMEDVIHAFKQLGFDIDITDNEALSEESPLTRKQALHNFVHSLQYALSQTQAKINVSAENNEINYQGVYSADAHPLAKIQTGYNYFIKDLRSLIDKSNPQDRLQIDFDTLLSLLPDTPTLKNRSLADFLKAMIEHIKIDGANENDLGNIISTEV